MSNDHDYDRVRDAVLEELVRKKGKSAYTHEVYAMARELMERRASEDRQPAPPAAVRIGVDLAKGDDVTAVWIWRPLVLCTRTKSQKWDSQRWDFWPRIDPGARAPQLTAQERCLWHEHLCRLMRGEPLVRRSQKDHV